MPCGKMGLYNISDYQKRAQELLSGDAWEYYNYTPERGWCYQDSLKAFSRYVPSSNASIVVFIDLLIIFLFHVFFFTFHYSYLIHVDTMIIYKRHPFKMISILKMFPAHSSL